jgi:hypothetical protein
MLWASVFHGGLHAVERLLHGGGHLGVNRDEAELDAEIVFDIGLVLDARPHRLLKGDLVLVKRVRRGEAGGSLQNGVVDDVLQQVGHAGEMERVLRGVLDRVVHRGAHMHDVAVAGDRITVRQGAQRLRLDGRVLAAQLRLGGKAVPARRGLDGVGARERDAHQLVYGIWQHKHHARLADLLLAGTHGLAKAQHHRDLMRMHLPEAGQNEARQQEHKDDFDKAEAALERVRQGLGARVLDGLGLGRAFGRGFGALGPQGQVYVAQGRLGL